MFPYGKAARRPDCGPCPPHRSAPRPASAARSPALPARDVGAAVVHYRERFGFAPVHQDDGFAVLRRDDAELHLWGAVDEGWRTRADLAGTPIDSGAESFIAGTASCRIEVADVDALYAELREAGVLHSVSVGGVTTTD